MAKFSLYRVAAYDPEDGTIHLKDKLVAAKDEASAKNKAVGKLSENLPEGVTLDQLLDKVEIEVSPF